MSRREFSRKTRAQAFTRCGGRCEKCSAHLKVGEGEYDHILEAALGGDNSLDNCQVLCVPCHREKTRTGVRAIRKSDRMRDKHSGAFKRTRRLRGQGFTKAPPQNSTRYPNKWTGYRRPEAHE